MSLNSKLIGLVGWRRFVVMFTAGALLALSMAPLFWWWTLFFTVPALVIALDGIHGSHYSRRNRLKQAAWSGWAFGFGYFLVGMHWLAYPFLVEAEKFIWLLPFAVSLLPAGLALFYAAAAALALTLWSERWPRYFALAGAFALAEWLRASLFTGFPWNTIGSAITWSDTMMQSVGLLGVFGLTALAILIGAAPVSLMQRFRHRLEKGAAVVCTIAVLVSMHLYGQRVLPPVASQSQLAGPSVRLVQPNITQKDKLSLDKINANFKRLVDQSKLNGAGRVDDMAGTNIVIWPESVFRFIVMEQVGVLRRIAKFLPENTQLVTGAMRAERTPAASGGGYRVWNSVFVFDTEAKRTASYDKRHLVPFGEYLPAQDMLESLGLRQLTDIRGGFTAGAGNALLSIAGLPPALSLVCYEVIFPGEVASDMRQLRAGSGPKPTWILNVTNDAWFGPWFGPHQHLHQTRLRSVEQGVPTLRVANTGITAVIDSYGRVLKHIPLNTRGSIDTKLPKAGELTTYATYDFYVSLLSVLFCLGVSLLPAITRSS